MPVVQISLIQGRSKEMKRNLINKVSGAIAEALQITEDKIHIVLHEVPVENTTSARAKEGK